MRCLRERRVEVGSASVQAVVLVAAVALIALVLAALAGMLVAQRRAAAAADLAALAGAGARVQGGEGCPEAGRVAASNEAHLVACDVAGPVVTVEVVTTLTSLLGWTFDVSSRARAGPAP